MAWARLDDEGIVQEVTDDNPAGRFHASVMWYVVPTGTMPGDRVSGDTVTRHSAPPLPPANLNYVPLSKIRERVMAEGKWGEMALALDMLAPDKRWMLLTLSAGIGSDDAEVRDLLTTIGCDPNAILAPEAV